MTHISLNVEISTENLHLGEFPLFIVNIVFCALLIALIASLFLLVPSLSSIRLDFFHISNNFTFSRFFIELSGWCRRRVHARRTRGRFRSNRDFVLFQPRLRFGNEDRLSTDVPSTLGHVRSARFLHFFHT